MNMHLHTIFPLFGVLVLTTANRQGQPSCASFKTDTKLIPANEGVTTEKHCPHVMVAALSACATVGVIISICFCVFCIRKGGQAGGCSGRPLPQQQPPSPRAQDEDVDNRPTDNAAGAFGVATGAQSASKGDNRLQAVRSAASQARFHRQHVSSGSSQPCSPVYDGDGYLLADPPLFLRTKRHASKPFFADSKV